MDYVAVTLTGLKGFDSGILMAGLAELGFESFLEEEDQLQAFIRNDQYDASVVNAFLHEAGAGISFVSVTETIPDQNWNARWESEYEPVVIDGKCMIRAPFHSAQPGMSYDIIIEPRMSFGTAHHETTRLMLSMLMQEVVEGKNILDMGSGTGVLAILACKMGANEVTAIDNDEWAYNNAIDNVLTNTSAVHVILGDAGSIPSGNYQLVLANINRNVLLNDIPVYSQQLSPGGVLLLSGFYENDLDAIIAVANGAGFQYDTHRVDNEWTGARFIKISA